MTFEEYNKQIEELNKEITINIQTKNHNENECYQLKLPRRDLDLVFRAIEAGSFLAIPVDGYTIYVNPLEIRQITIPS